MFFIRFVVIIVLLLSCSSEKVTLSPIYNSFSNETPQKPTRFPDRFNDKTGEVFYASELLSHISTFPKFQNTALNDEVIHLKHNIKEYVYAVQSYNLTKQEKSLYNIEKSYKKIQRLRKYLNKNDDEIINRYLVRIKSNISQLQTLKQDSAK